jgi:hypothetical protein
MSERNDAQCDEIYELLSRLAGIDTHDINLRDHPEAWELFEGKSLVPDYRGYANLGTGQYALNNSDAGEPAELIISIATEEEKQGRQIGDSIPNLAGAIIQPEQMAIRIRFHSVQGLEALEKQLAAVRAEHFPGL